MSPAGLTASSLADSNAITYDGHGFETDDPVTVRALTGGELSDPLVAGTTYYVRRLSNSAFELAEAPSGDAIDLTTDSFSLVVAREPDFDMWIGFYSRWLDLSLQAHAVPFGRTEAVHPVIVGLCADLVAERMFNISGQPTTEAMKSVEVAVVAQLARFTAGLPLRGAAAPAPTNLAITSTLGNTTDPRGWGSRTLP